MSKEGSHFISASSDKTAKLIDTQTLEPLRTFYTGRPVNSADMSPIYNHVRSMPTPIAPPVVPR